MSEGTTTVETQVYRGTLRAILVAVAVLLALGCAGWVIYDQATLLSDEECAEVNAERLLNEEGFLDCY